MNLERNDVLTSQKLISLLTHTDKYPTYSLQKALHYLNQSLSKGYDPTNMNYFLFNELIQKEGIPRSVVYPFLKKLVAHPKFVYKKDATHYPTETTMSYLAGSAYWFDKELFNPKTKDKSLLTLVDIGVLLIQKGFHFPNLSQIQNPEILPYMRTYIQKVQQKSLTSSRKTKSFTF